MAEKAKKTVNSLDAKPMGFKNKVSYELKDWRKSWKNNYDLYLLIIPVLVYFIVFCYIPMYGIQIAFKNYSPALGFADSPWVGLEHLTRFINSHYFWRLLKNTIGMSVYGIVIGIPAPIFLALLFTEIKTKKLKVTAQALSYAPNFISVVVASGMLIMFLTPNSGFINEIAVMFGYESSQSLLSNPKAFWHIFVLSNLWQGVGWSSVIYTAAIEGVPVELFEAAKMEGASRFVQMKSIIIPSIMPTIIILSIMAVGGILGVGHEKIILLQNALNVESSEVISTYVYKSGLQQAQYSFASMIGLFNSVISFVLLVIVNSISKRVSETSLW